MRYSTGEDEGQLDTKCFAKLMKDHQLCDDEEKINAEFAKADLDQDGQICLGEFFEYFQQDHYG